MLGHGPCPVKPQPLAPLPVAPPCAARSRPRGAPRPGPPPDRLDSAAKARNVRLAASGRARSRRGPHRRHPRPPRRARAHPQRVRRGLSRRRGATFGRRHRRPAARGGARERAPDRDRGPPLRVRGLAARRRGAHAARVRAPRRPAARPARALGHARLRAHRARRAAVWPRGRRRQGDLHHARGCGLGLARDGAPPAPEPQVPGRGRGGDRIAGARGLPGAPRARAPRRRGGAGRHRQLRRRPSRAHLPAAGHLPGGRRGALSPAAGAQRFLRRADAGRGPHPGEARGRPRAEGRLARRAGALPRRGRARPAPAPPHPLAALQRKEVPGLGRDEAGDALRRRAGLLGVGAAVDAARAHRDRARGASAGRLLEPGDRLGAGAAVAAHRAAHGRAPGRGAAGAPPDHPAARRRADQRTRQRHRALVDHRSRGPRVRGRAPGAAARATAASRR